MIPLFKVFMSDSVDEAVSRVLHSGYVGEGNVVKDFERAIGKVICNRHVLTVNSGTSALMMALRLAGVDFGARVLTTPMTCLATNEPILALGADPIWVDVNPKTGNMCPESLAETAARSSSLTKAILCVDWGGYPCDLEEILEVAKTYGIPVVEDAAHDFGASYHREPIGKWADFTCFSFQAIKTITSVDGGAIAFKDPSVVERARLMRWYGLDREKGAVMRCLQDPPEFGYKFHMNDLNAAIGLENLKHLDDLLEQRRLQAQMYQEGLRGLERVKMLERRADRVSSNWLFTVLVDDSNDFCKYLESEGIESSKVHGRNDMKSIFAISMNENLPGVDEFYDKQVNIPIGFWLSLKDVEYIVDTIRRY